MVDAMFGSYVDSILAKLDLLRTDVLGLHLTIVADNMYKTGMLSKEKYGEILRSEYELVSNQLTNYKSRI